MPKEIAPIPELQVKAIEPKVSADGTLDVDVTTVGRCSGLYLYTGPAGTKTSVLRATLHRKRVEFGLGSYATSASTCSKQASKTTETSLTLKAARWKGMALREQIADYID